MKGKNTQKLIPVFNFPVFRYKDDMKTNLSKEKKEEIIDLLTNHNQLKSEEEFEDVKYKLHYACQEGDLDHIKILLSETIPNDSNDLFFKIDKTKQTASLFKVNQNLNDLLIPRTVKYEMKDYLITSITGLGCSNCRPSNFKTIKFEQNSSVSTIYGHALSCSNIEKIFCQKNLIELKEGWCCEARKLTNFIISPLNGQFIFKDDKYLLGKSDVKNDEFDTFLFVRRDIKEFCFPPNIKIIGSFSFSESILEHISIPPNLTKICASAFSSCRNLKKVEIPANSNLQIIDRFAFAYSTIEEISIPQSVTKICESAFSSCYYLRKVEIPTNSNLQIIEDRAFQDSGIEEISIPLSVTKICKYAFSMCRGLKKVEFPTNSNLQIIEKYAFSQSRIKRICIPSSLTEMCPAAFSMCRGLKKVEFPTNSNW